MAWSAKARAAAARARKMRAGGRAVRGYRTLATKIFRGSSKQYRVVASARYATTGRARFPAGGGVNSGMMRRSQVRRYKRARGDSVTSWNRGQY